MTARLSRTTLVAYAAPAVIGSTLSLSLQTFAAPFYATQVGLGATLVGVIFGAVRIVDLVFDPLFGLASDPTRTRWGRRRPWFVIIAPVLMTALWFFFNPPSGAGAAYLSVLLVLVYLGWSVATISHMALGTELTSDYRERNRVSAMREFGVVAGILATLGASAGLELFFGADQRAKTSAMGTTMIVMIPISVAILCAFVRERPAGPPRRADWLGAWKLVASHPALRGILLVDLLLALATAIRSGLYIFLADKVFGLGDRSSTLLLVQFVAGFAGIELWTQLAHRKGRSRTLAWACLLGAGLSPLIFLFPRDPSSFWLFFAVNAVGGLGFGAGAVLLRALLGDVVDRDAAQRGDARTGAFFAFLIMTQKFGQAAAIALTYPLLDLIGFSGRAGAANPPQTLNGLLMLFALAPMALYLAAVAILWRFPRLGAASPAAATA
jgi:GPH family glycoside/pentoside/hexuronide:cation symporter